MYRALAQVLLLCALTGTAVQADSINLLIWDEYIDPDLLTDFEAETGIAVIPTYYSSDDSRDALLRKQRGGGFDVIQLSADMIDSYRALDWLAPLQASQLPNRTHIDARWQYVFGHAVPYFWGTIGIAWRSDLIERPPHSWDELIADAAAWSGKFTMLNSSVELMYLGMLAEGTRQHNDFEGDELERAYRRLLQQRTHVHSYSYPELDAHSALVNGDMHMAVVYNGDAEYLRQFNEHIAYTTPAEGSVVWLDVLAVSAQSSRAAQAHQFINFLNRPDIAARLADYVYYASPNRAARELMDVAYLNNSTIFPAQEVLDKSRAVQQPPPQLNKRLKKLYFELTRGKLR